jgi:hypothetical protein
MLLGSDLIADVLGRWMVTRDLANLPTMICHGTHVDMAPMTDVLASSMGP